MTDYMTDSANPTVPRDHIAHVVRSTNPAGWLVVRWCANAESGHFVYLSNARVPGSSAVWQTEPYAYSSEQDAEEALMWWHANQ